MHSSNKINKAFFIGFRKANKNLAQFFFLLSLGIPFAFNCQNYRVFAATPSNRSSLLNKSFVSNAINRSGPAVVTIETQRTVISRANQSFPPRIFIDPYFDDLFGFKRIPRSPRMRSKIEKSQGSGFIFSPEGLILTNAHVVEKIDQLTVGLSNGQRVTGRVAGIDILTDLAVIRLEGTGPWPTAPLGNSNKVEVGDWAIAVGNPYGLENTVTLGIISNLNRNVSQLGISDKRLTLIQTDAAINPGNSGGPLLNGSGEVIGINTLVRTGPGAGLGFAIPINLARDIANQLISKGKATHPMIGVGLTSINNVDKNENDMNNYGVIVRYVIQGGPGDLGGLEVNDRILKVGGVEVKKPMDVINQINIETVNKPLEFKVKRNNSVLILFITPKDMVNIR